MLCLTLIRQDDNLKFIEGVNFDRETIAAMENHVELDASLYNYVVTKLVD